MKKYVRQISLVIIIAVAVSTVLAAAPALPATLTETDAGAVSIVKGSGINLVSRIYWGIRYHSTLNGKEAVLVPKSENVIALHLDGVLLMMYVLLHVGLAAFCGCLCCFSAYV